MKNRTKIFIVTFTLVFVLLLSILIIFFATRDSEDNKNYNYIDLSNTSLNFYNMDNDFYTYNLDGYKESIGVDLSEHNIDVDFNKLKDQGIEYTILRLGWRGYINPSLHLDAKFNEFYENAKKADMKIGVYFFSQAINEDEAIEEANYVIDVLKDKGIDTYVAYDFETIEDINARTNDLTRDKRTAIAYAFLNTIKDAGYNPLLYTNYDWIKHHYKIEILHEFPIWYAQYSKFPQYKGKYYIWQYATNVHLEGVASPDGVDLNIMIKKEETN